MTVDELLVEGDHKQLQKVLNVWRSTAVYGYECRTPEPSSDSETAFMTLNQQTGTDTRETGDLAVLVSRARAGDTVAFDHLMRRCERQVFGTAWRLLGTVEDAQDASQEVFLRLYRHLGRVDPSRPLQAWLYRVTVNVCHDLGRRLRKRRTVAIEEIDRSRPLRAVDPASDPAAAAALAEQKQIVAEGLRTLTEKERRALVLRDVRGLSSREVAGILGSSEATVRSHICRGRLKMKRFRDQRLKAR